MASKPLTSETIALTEKKMDMSLDDIIKMSKKSLSKAKKQPRAPNKGQKDFNNAVQHKARKVRQYMGSRSALRQGVLAQRRSNLQATQFPFAIEVAGTATVSAARNRAFNRSTVANKISRPRFGPQPVQRRGANVGFAAKQRHQQKQQWQRQRQEENAVPNQRPQTLDSLFATMKEKRMKGFPHPNNSGGAHRNGGGRLRVPWARGRFGN